MERKVQCEHTDYCTVKDCPHKEKHDCTPLCNLRCNHYDRFTTCKEVQPNVVG